MTEYPREAYAHLWRTLYGSSLDDKPPDDDLWERYCVSEGVTEWAPCRGGQFYRATAKGEVELREHLKQPSISGEQPAATTAAQQTQTHNDGWMLVSDAVVELQPFIKNLRALDKFAKDNPGKLRLRPHPTHQRRRQAACADVLRLKRENERAQFDALGKPAAEGLPSLSEGGLADLARRVQQTRVNKKPKPK